MPIPTFPLRGKEYLLWANEKITSLPLRGRCAETWSRGPNFGDATVEAHISTRAIAALHPAAGSHPSAKADGTCSALRGRRVGVVFRRDGSDRRVSAFDPHPRPSPEGEGRLEIPFSSWEKGMG